MESSTSSEESPGDRIWLFGGYDYQPMWLQGNEGYGVEIVNFIPGQNVERATVVNLDGMIHLPDARGRYVVPELRNEGAKWLSNGIVHIEL